MKNLILLAILIAASYSYHSSDFGVNKSVKVLECLEYDMYRGVCLDFGLEKE